MSWIDLLVASAAQGTILLLAAGAASICLRRSSSAVRHFVWTGALTGLLLLPLVQLAAHQWRLPIATATPLVFEHITESSPATVITVRGQAPIHIAWPLLIWALGFLATTGWFLAGFARVRRMARMGFSADFSFAEGVPVLLSPAAPVPMTFGIVRPAIILPPDAQEWLPARLRTVLVHELSHIRRRDLLAQRLGQFACCLYWFHPLVWLATRQLAQERERACDDAVLASGISAPDYAAHLTALARSLGGRAMHTPAMAESSYLETRVRALLDRGRNRRPLSGAVAAAVALAVMALLLPVAAVRAQAPASQATSAPIVLAGVVQDSFAARIPRVQVVAHNMDAPGGTDFTATTDMTGIYRFAALPPGKYEVAFVANGFAKSTREVTLVAGQPSELDATLAIGATQQTITVRGQRNTATPAPASRPQRLRIGGMVQSARLFHQVPPVYPPDLQQQGIAGLVTMKAAISVSGEPINLEVISPASDPRLAQAALDAVRQWRYQPALLNGEPVQTDTQITVNFQLDQ